MLFFLYLSFFIFSFFLFFFFFFFSSRRRHTRSLRDWSSDVCSSDLRAVFNPHRFGPPLGVTPASPCSWVDRPGFGSTPGYSRALVTGLAFAAAPLQSSLASHPSSNSPDHNAKGTQSARMTGEPASRLLPLVGMWFQALFHSPHRGAFHLSLTVLVHYRSHGSL